MKTQDFLYPRKPLTPRQLRKAIKVLKTAIRKDFYTRRGVSGQ